ncbi:MAG: hypothetical protein IJ291_01655 [Lachnospiraceae bacterium]|nr:hypothetical protein [Lachnospiraceae bacterium]
MNTTEQNKKDEMRALNDIAAGVAGAFKWMDNTETAKVLEEYKQEMLQYLTQKDSASENPMKRASQEHWYSLYLEKKRLEAHRIQVHYDQYKHVSNRPGEKPVTLFNNRPDGKYALTSARQTTLFQKKYIRNHAVIGQTGKTCEMDYYILHSRSKEGLYICPGCGAEQTLDQLLDGCDYCNAKFDVSAYDAKVISVSEIDNIFKSRETTSNQTAAIIQAVILTLIGLPAILFGSLLVPVTLGLSLIIAAAGGVALYFVYRIIVNNYKNTFEPVFRMREHNPGFSTEEFIGSLDSKLKAIHYASDPQELGAFVKCDITPCLKNYQNIIDCETGQICYKKFSIKDDYQYIELHREIRVLNDCGNNIKAGRGIVKVVLAKKLSHKLKNDVALYRCSTCGSSISLVEGGKCKYCGNEMDYAAYDWVVVHYRHVRSL